ncbi:MAG: chemotaxis protein CheW [Syntrophobacteraceae bacterium]
MDMQDDLIRDFVAEAREHLADIEMDLLTIEEAGADIDEELVNKVFRAAHSIKGGSSFFGLTKIKELAHKAETVLDMVRSRQMVPNPEITNILLAAFDRLRDMINNVSSSEDADIFEHVASLTQLASSYLPENRKESLTQVTLLQPGDNAQPVAVPQIDFDRARRVGQYIYLIRYDLIHDIERQGKNVLQVFKDLFASGEILDCAPDFDAVGTLEDPISNQIPLRMTFASIIEPDVIGVLFDVAEEKIELLFDPSQPQESHEAGSFEETSDPVSPEPETFHVEPETAAPEAPAVTVYAEAIPSPGSQGNGKGLHFPQAGATDLPLPQGEGWGEGKSASIRSPKADSEKQDGDAKAKASARSGESTLRVDVSLLETLMNLAGELVLSRNQLREAVAQNDRRALTASSQRINLVTSELQDAIMQTRMQPIGNVFSKFPRVVRDIAQLMGKDIQIDIRGKEVELDKSLIEGLSDPLTHMVRNAADHGVETPDERRRSGKKGQGTIRLEARHEAGQVVVEIADDGKGIDPHKIAASALKKGLITQEKLQSMSDKDKIGLVFLPGLSTAEKVTDVSGRGVGMDVVKTNLDRLGGKVEIESELGKGTRFRIKLPLTLAIIPSLIVTVEGDRFAIPQINVVELLHIRAELVKKRIEVVGDAEVLILRDQIVPLVRFSDFLGILPTYLDPQTGKREICRRTRIADRRSPHRALHEETGEAAELAGTLDCRDERRRTDGRRQTAASDIEIVVVTTGTMQYGLVVDSFQNTEEIVVKPLGRHIKGLQEYAGATIMGDGKVALILDVNGLAAKRDLTALSGSGRAVELAEEAERERLLDVQSLLLFYNAPGELCATPLDTVLRVERVSRQQVETVGGRRTMQYRGASLPLVTLSDVAGVMPIDEEQDLAVIVSSVHGREVGLLGAMPVDVVETHANIDQVTHRQTGIAGSAILRDKTVLLTDMFELVEAVYPEWGAARERVVETEQGPTTVLLAEDSDFFRATVKRFIEDGGYNVLDAADGQAAWELLLKNVDKVRGVVTDIEMPRLTGLGLTQKIRSEPRVAGLPIIGLTSLAADEDIAKGKAAGITDYQIKLDRDKLLDALHELVPA